MEKLFHVIVTRRDPKTGERIDDFRGEVTATPCTHTEACTIISKRPGYASVVRRTSSGRSYRASYELEPVPTLPDGWYLTGTGGGCTALQRDLEPIDGERAYALITDAVDSHTAPRDLSGPLLIGFYQDDDQRDTFEGTLAECLAWLDDRNRGEQVSS